MTEIEALIYKIFPNQLTFSRPLPSWNVLMVLKEFDLKLPEYLRSYDIDLKSAAVFSVISGQGIVKVTTHFINVYQLDTDFKTVERPILLATNFTYNQLALNEYKSMGVSMYSVLASLDCKTCEKCGAMDGKHFRLNEAIVGETYPPFCDCCRCTTVAYYPGEDSQGKRIARNPETGWNYYVDCHMTYEQWRKDVKKQYGNGIIKKAKMKYDNLRADMDEQRRMAKICGKEIPLKIADFQHAKYDNIDLWNKLQEQYVVFKKIADTDLPDKEKRRLRKEYRTSHQQ